LDEYTFALEGTYGSQIFSGNVPVGPQGDNETELGSDFSIWMLSGMTPMLDGQTILGVFPALNEGTSEDLYSTMVQMTVVDPTTVAAGENPPFVRLGNTRLFYPSEVQYGSLALSAAIDGYLYLFGGDNTGVKIARTPDTPTSIADRNQYEYYNAMTATWQAQEPLALNDAAGNIISWNSTTLTGAPTGPNIGDLWYDPYHQTTVMTWGDGGIDGTFWFTYAINNDLTGPWSDPVAIYTPPSPTECSDGGWNYQGHAHPGWDASGETLLISWSSCAQYVTMAVIEWA
jgi:hypothetical protein